MQNQKAAHALVNIFGLVIHAAADVLVQSMKMQEPKCLHMYQAVVDQMRTIDLFSVVKSDEELIEAVIMRIDKSYLNRNGYFQLVDGRRALVARQFTGDDVFVIWPKAEDPTQLNCIKSVGRWTRLQQYEMCVTPQILSGIFAGARLS